MPGCVEVDTFEKLGNKDCDFSYKNFFEFQKTGNNIGKDGIKELCEGLTKNKTLLKLDISGRGTLMNILV